MAKVLVVDDRAVNRELIVTLLKYVGHQSIEAADGDAALRMVRAEHPDLVVCDILMPTMDGYEFVRRLRADPDIAQTTVIFCTATFLERETRSLAAACGVSSVLTKPCEPEEILHTIEQALAHATVPHTLPVHSEFDRDHLRLVTDKLALKVDELEAANRRLAALTDLNLQLASERDPYALLAKVCKGARDLIGARHAILAVNDKGDNPAMRLATSGLTAAQVEPLQRLRIDAGPLGEVMADGRSRRFVQLDGDPLSAGLAVECMPVHSGLIAPILSLHRTYGWVLLIDKLGGDEFTAEDEHILAIHAAQAGRIYENGSLYNEVKRTADQLQIEMMERERAAQKLLEANQTLEMRVKLRTAELQDIIEGLESFNRSVSHDLRGPLGGIAGAARMARDLIAANDCDQAGRMLLAIAGQAETTGKMVNALLALARAGDVSPRRTDMDALVREVIESMQRERTGGPLPVTVLEGLPVVDADPDLARQVLVNLIGNALKFTARVSEPLVEIGMDDAPGEPVFFVRDNGIGFDPDKAQRLFKPFQRLHGARFEGFGIGLSIVKRIIDRHGGRLWAESVLGAGATFHFSFGRRGTEEDDTPVSDIHRL